jgi:hypothetical protein
MDEKINQTKQNFTPYLMAPSFAQATAAMYTYSSFILALFFKTTHRI